MGEAIALALGLVFLIAGWWIVCACFKNDKLLRKENSTLTSVRAASPSGEDKQVEVTFSEKLV